MNKRTLIGIIPAAALLLLAACTQDEPGGQGNELPYGEYPLQIGGVTLNVESGAEPWSAEGPQTRVTEDNTDGKSSVWEWDGSETIRVQLGDETADYTLNVGEELTPDRQLYWTSTDPARVTAWYPTDETIDFSDQTNGLAYLLKAEVQDATYNNEITLGFKHQLAKVRLVLSGTQAGMAQSVEVYGYTTCTNNEGAPVTDGSTTQGWIKMKHTTYTDGTECWEANVVPDVVIDRVKVNGIETTLTTPLTPVVAALNTITISVEQAPTEIDLGTCEGTTLTVSGKTILKGDGQQKNLQITVEPDTELTLQDVNIFYNEGPTIICQGTAHITLSGTNQLSPTSKGADPFYSDLGSGIEVRSSGTLTIESEPKATLTITRRRTDTAIYLLYGAGIGLYENANLVIKGGTITVTGGSPTAEGGANIGEFVSQDAGTITLEGGTFTLQNQCMLSSLVGAGSYGTCGTVTIRAGVTINGTTYAEDHVGVIKE
ncbi:fimbrillin family protein [Bacteroides sp. AN502]|uniref:fimbrillin family protein n=1 Tax=Bacteroides ndongoniae TaxID=1903262 RepID=UPI0008D9FF23|nr:fimbrillin family protein [Bacteroides ndongoniae]MBV8039596.1 fimbrillin family protein [Caecibacteroides pullorum]MDC6280223.1 fimbrillin family protein [Caecibacteroides pullorum]